MYTERAVKLLKQMRDNCVPKETDAYNDPLRKEKHEALSMAIAQLSSHTGTHARWIVKRMAGERIVLQCSACQNYENDSVVRGKYCWYCGAKMDAKEKTGD